MARQQPQHLGANREHAGVPAFEVRGVRRQGEHDGQPGDDRLHDPERSLGVRHPDVDVQAADTLPPRGRTRVLDELAVAIDGRDLLLRRNAGRIRTGGRDVVTVALGNLARCAPQLHQALDRFVRALARLRRELDDRCVQLGLQRARQAATGRSGNEDLDCRHELARLRIEDPELLLDTDGQGAPEVLFDQLALTPWTGPPAASHA